MSPAARATFCFDEPPWRGWPSISTEIVPAADALFPGMFARLSIPLGSKIRIRLPSRAVAQAGQLEFVYVRTPAGDARRFVRTGTPESDGTVIVRRGISSGEIVVVPEL